jgi:predicted AAA+ superfamily ATPase
MFNLQGEGWPMLPRTLAEQLTKDSASYPVLTVTGPRQSGKTTLARAAFPDHSYASLEDPELRAYAQDDPRGFLNQFSGGVILDEVQRTPDLFSYIQVAVDEDDRPGRFVLTGSQNFLLLRKIAQSLAGRCAVRHLLPFSMHELQRVASPPLDELGRQPVPPQAEGAASMLHQLFAGFYPRIHDKGVPPQDWLADYYRTYLERDVRDLLAIGDLRTFRQFVGLCAGRSGQLLNVSSLGNDAGVSHSTARRWLSVLEASFVVWLLEPHHRSFNKRLVKSPKLYFLDTGLLCYLLRIRSPEDLRQHSARGAVFESYVVAELLKRALHRGREPDLYFWRDSSGHEVDVLLEMGTTQVPVEIKSGETVNADFFKGLNYWKSLAGDDEMPAVLVYGGKRSYRRQGIQVLGWSQF